ncbi:hypothetical protein SAMN04488067_103121 [Halorubrum xinjiangense]|uniref:Uncharacterized protein n=1 Tax=Halorubrum xinjiangense TaxID=261291 RepID=A0A1G7JXK3_9EURY|nr:hypothetical protein [Halorubrum xinjiangense]SDF29673.1 hypothetical protein SAMN04488067_103121 [Halorubrum xinjiangense]
MSSSKVGDTAWPYTQLTAALLFSILLFIPIVLAGLPGVARTPITGLFTREEVLLLFFIGMPLVFTVFAVYRVAQFYGIFGGSEAN